MLIAMMIFVDALKASRPSIREWISPASELKSSLTIIRVVARDFTKKDPQTSVMNHRRLSGFPIESPTIIP